MREELRGAFRASGRIYNAPCNVPSMRAIATRRPPGRTRRTPRSPARPRHVPCERVPRPTMRFLNLQLRFLIPLLLTLVAAAYLATPLMDQLTLRWFSRDLNARGALVTNALSDSISAALERIARAAPADAVRPRRAGRAPVRDRPVLARRHAAAPDRELSAEPELPRGEDRVGAARPAALARRRPGPRRRAPGQRRDGTGRQPRAAARHELRRPAQPGHAPLPDRSSSPGSDSRSR